MERKTQLECSSPGADRPRPWLQLLTLLLLWKVAGCSLLVGDDPSTRHHLKVAALWIGEASEMDTWTLAHQEGFCTALRGLPEVVNVLAPEPPEGGGPPDPCRGPLALSNIDTPDKLRGAVGLAVSKGAQVIVANSLTHRRWILDLAGEYPDVKFLVAAALMPKSELELYPNIAPFYGLAEQAWFVAGYAAARASTTHRLGIVAAVPSPEQARNITAFALGAKQADGAGGTGGTTTLVELRWLGAWKDDGKRDRFSYQMSCGGGEQKLYGEEYLAAQLIDAGCDVIANMTDTPRVQRQIAAWQAGGPLKFQGVPRPIYAIGHDHSEACLDSAATAGSGKTLGGCMGVVQWDWSLLYRKILESILAEGWVSKNWVGHMTPAFEPSIVQYRPLAVDRLKGRGVEPSAAPENLLNRLRTAYAGREGARKVFAGAYRVNYGQRDDFGGANPGFTCPNPDWFLTCWLPDGVYDRKPISAKNHLELGTTLLLARVPTHEDSAEATRDRVLLPTPAGNYKHNCWDYY